jgi:quercetin dioxygenase-like cupin family protein
LSPVSRALTGKHLSFDFAEHIAELRRDDHYVQTGRIGRTLVKEGALRLTLTVLAEGADAGTHLTVLAEGADAGTHRAAAPMTLQLLEGRLRYRVGDDEFTIREGELLFFGPGHAKDIRALEDTALLLTITGAEEG